MAENGRTTRRKRPEGADAAEEKTERKSRPASTAGVRTERKSRPASTAGVRTERKSRPASAAGVKKAADAAGKAVKKVSETAKKAAGKAPETVMKAGSKVSEAAKKAGSKASETAKKAGSKASETAKKAGSKASETAKKTSTKAGNGARASAAKHAGKGIAVQNQMSEQQEFFTEMDQYLFGQGTHYDIFRKLGAHPMTWRGEEGTQFAVWAPHAAAVYVIGTFNGWDEESHPMVRKDPLGVYVRFIAGVGVGELYKFLIITQDGRKLYKADPFGNSAEFRPGTASKIADISGFKWTDTLWMTKRKSFKPDKSPIAIYEVHPGSWKKHPHDPDEPGYYNYREFAHALAEYVKEMGYTHVELMGIAEHPFDGSWGYQVTGYYAPTSRYGTPEDFAYMVNYLHRSKIGVILDWVPAHFPRDEQGLSTFDGTCLYEYADPRKGEHPDWGTKIFDLGKNEVKNFLIGNAIYWVEHFHVDGLRVDAVASMLYLDYGKQDGQWVPNQYGGNKNLEAIEFFKHLNSLMTGRYPGIMMIAEESTAWPKVTGRPEDDGLGFTLKWNMGWMHDFLEYMKLDPYFRQFNHNKMTFAMTYAYSERYVLVLSHDEVVHLKCSMINKMPGLYDDKFQNLKAGYSYMFGHPGKKLLFMGQDFGQFQEWSEARELDWYLLEEERHQQLQRYVHALLALYGKNKAMYEADCEPEGFEWINADDCSRSIFSFVRHSQDGKNNLLFVVNFTPVARPDYRVGVPKKKQYKLVLNSDAAEFGGSGKEQPEVYKAVEQECDGRKFSFAYDLPGYGVAVFKF